MEGPGRHGYRAKPKKGYFWQDEINSTRYFIQKTERDKRRRAPPPPKDKASAKRAEQELAEKWFAASKEAVRGKTAPLLTGSPWVTAISRNLLLKTRNRISC